MYTLYKACVTVNMKACNEIFKQDFGNLITNLYYKAAKAEYPHFVRTIPKLCDER